MSREDDKTEEGTSQATTSEVISRALKDTEPGRLLQYTCKAPAAPEGYQNRLRVVYSQVFYGLSLLYPTNTGIKFKLFFLFYTVTKRKG